MGMPLHRKARGGVHAGAVLNWLLLWATLILAYVLTAKTLAITRSGCVQSIDRSSISSSEQIDSSSRHLGSAVGQYSLAAVQQQQRQQRKLLPRSLASRAADAIGQLEESGNAADSTQQAQQQQQGKAGTSEDRKTCLAGYLTGSRKVYWKHLDGASPALMDLLHAEDRVYAVFNLKQQQNCVGYCGESSHMKLPWAAEGKWSMVFPAISGSNLDFPETAVTAQPLAMDGHGHTLTIYATIPRRYADVPTDIPLNITIKAAVTSGDQTHEKLYDNVPLCLRPPTALPYHLTACTGILPDAVHAVPEWVAYHAFQGFDHFVVYIDGPAEEVKQKLQPLVTAGLLTIVDFNFPASAKRNFYSQQAIQNSCIMHARGQTRWLALHDVDEYLQVPVQAPSMSQIGDTHNKGDTPKPPKQTVAELLHQHSGQEHLAAFAVCMYFFGSSTNGTAQAVQSAAGKGITIGKYVYRAEQYVCEQREKLIVNPHSTAYVSVHVVTTGGQVKRLDAEKELRLVHYKSPGSSKYPVLDASMAAYADAVRSKLDSIYPAAT